MFTEDDNKQLADALEALSISAGYPANTNTSAPTMEDIFASIEQEIEPEPVVEPTPVEILNGGVLDAETSRRIRMLQVVSKFASTLTLRPIKVALSSRRDNNWVQGAPAWSDSDHIWFNSEDMGELSDIKTIVGIKGLSLHEIAHILLTPRAGSNLAKDVHKAGYWRAFNALEDQRIEMFMTKRFGNVADWLTASVANFIMDEPKQWSVAFPLLHGRKYLPKDLRDQVRGLYEQPQNTAEIANLIDRYIVLNLADPKNYATAFDITKRYHELVEQLQPTNQSWDPNGGWKRIEDPNGHDQRKGGEWKASKSKPMSKAEQEKLGARVAVAVELDSQSGAGDGDGDGQPDGDNGDEGNKPGNGSSATGSDSLADLAKTIHDKVMANKSKEIAQILKQYNADAELTSTGTGKPERIPSTQVDVAPEAIQAAKSFANELERLRRDFDPGWKRRTEAGRLNIQRYVTGTDLDECFDEWDNGREDAVDIEAVILLDVSGSMYNLANGAYQSMWAIKRALDKVNASTTVLAFDHRSFILYDSSERAGARMKQGSAHGGTDPLASLKYAKNVLAESNRAIKLCITITDGVWSNDDESNKILREFRRAGVVTALAFVNDVEAGWYREGQPIDSHGCEVAVNVTEMSALFTLGRSMVKVGIARNLERA